MCPWLGARSGCTFRFRAADAGRPVASGKSSPTPLIARLSRRIDHSPLCPLDLSPLILDRATVAPAAPELGLSGERSTPSRCTPPRRSWSPTPFIWTWSRVIGVDEHRWSHSVGAAKMVTSPSSSTSARCSTAQDEPDCSTWCPDVQ